MGKYVNTVVDRFLLWTTTLVVSGLNVLLLVDTLRNLLH
jgi:Mn2+/Fe2+ NRAMP family transporter